MTDKALRVAVKLQNLQVAEHGKLEREKQRRLVRVVSRLLEFKPEEEAAAWMLKANPGFGGVAPMDLVESRYATEKLLEAVSLMKMRRGNGKS